LIEFVFFGAATTAMDDDEVERVLFDWRFGIGGVLVFFFFF
jgi:hypothetical protein